MLGRSVRRVGGPGLSTEDFNYNLNSDLLPGFDFSSQYSLFQGSTLSDTARFKPYLHRYFTATFNINRDQNPFAVLARIFGKAAPGAARDRASPAATRCVRATTTRMREAIAAQPVAGSARGGDRFHHSADTRLEGVVQLPVIRVRVRQPGAGVIDYDPRARCIAQVGHRAVPARDLYRESSARNLRTTVPVTSAHGRRAAVSHSADHVDQLEHLVQSDPKVVGELDNDVRCRAPRVREPYRAAPARPARLACDVRVHAIAEREFRVQLHHRPEARAGHQVRLQSGDRALGRILEFVSPGCPHSWTAHARPKIASLFTAKRYGLDGSRRDGCTSGSCTHPGLHMKLNRLLLAALIPK